MADHAPKPEGLIRFDRCRPERIPEAMRAEPRFCTWRYEPAGKDGNRTKVPYRPDGRKADKTAADDWRGLDDCIKAIASAEGTDRPLDGIGFLLGGGWAGIDFDKVTDGEGNFSATMRKIVEPLFGVCCYVERSPSGVGVKAILRVDPGRVAREVNEACRKDNRECVRVRLAIEGAHEVEFHFGGGYFTLTGHALNVPEWAGERFEEDATEAYVKVARRAMAVKERAKGERSAAPAQAAAARECTTLTDEQVRRLAFNAKNGQEVQALYNGCNDQHHGDASAGDMALANHLAFYAGPNGAEQVVRLLRSSPRWRDKFDRPDYLPRTVDAAYRDRTDFYDHGRGRADPGVARPARAGDVPKRAKFAPIPALDLMRLHTEYRPTVIDGLLRKGETMNVVAAPKVGKSWLVHGLALAVASGTPWLGRRTERGGVLLVDGELHEETLAMRISRVREAMRIADDRLSGFECLPVRGRRLTIDDIADDLRHAEVTDYRLVVIDALYRFLPIDGEENANETMTRVYNTLDAMANATGAAVVVVHHSSKGDQSGKSVTDVGAGAGAQSRATDTHLVLRPHEEEGAVVVEAAVRSFPPMDPFVIRSTQPGWELAHDLDPKRLRQAQRRRGGVAATEPERKPVEQWTVGRFAEEIVGPDKSIKGDLIDRAKARGLSTALAKRLLTQAEEAGMVRRVVEGELRRHYFTTSAPARPATFDDLEGEGSPAQTPPPVLTAPGGVGGVCVTPLPPSARGGRGDHHPNVDPPIGPEVIAT